MFSELRDVSIQKKWFVLSQIGSVWIHTSPWDQL